MHRARLMEAPVSALSMTPNFMSDFGAHPGGSFSMDSGEIDPKVLVQGIMGFLAARNDGSEGVALDILIKPRSCLPQPKLSKTSRTTLRLVPSGVEIELQNNKRISVETTT